MLILYYLPGYETDCLANVFLRVFSCTFRLSFYINNPWVSLTRCQMLCANGIISAVSFETFYYVAYLNWIRELCSRTERSRAKKWSKLSRLWI